MKNFILAITFMCTGIIHSKAQIIYTDYIPDLFISSDGTTTWEEIILDANNDTQPEMKIIIWDDQGEWFQGDIDLLPLLPTNETNADVISNNNCEALYLESSDSISISSDFTNFNPCTVDGLGLICIYETSTQNSYGLWPGQKDKFLGFRFRVGIDNFYGWIRMDVTADCDSIIIKDFAYNNMANQGILAGQMVLNTNEINAEIALINFYQNSLYIDLKNESEINLKVLSLEGKLVFSHQFSNVKEIFNLTFLSDGIYIVSLENEFGKTVKKISKH